jgi:hypothetical protein
LFLPKRSYIFIFFLYEYYCHLQKIPLHSLPEIQHIQIELLTVFLFTDINFSITKSVSVYRQKHSVGIYRRNPRQNMKKKVVRWRLSFSGWFFFLYYFAVIFTNINFSITKFVSIYRQKYYVGIYQRNPRWNIYKKIIRWQIEL